MEKCTPKMPAITEYLRVVVLRLLVMEQSYHFSRWVKADVHLETRVARPFPALCSTAVWTVHIPNYSGVDNSAACLIGPHAGEKDKDSTWCYEDMQQKVSKETPLIRLFARPFLNITEIIQPITCQNKSAGWWFPQQSTSWWRRRPCWGPAGWLCPLLPSELSLSSSCPGPHIHESSGRWI